MATKQEDISNSIRLDLERLTSHFRLSERLCYGFAAVCGGVLWWLLGSYIPNQFNDKLPDGLKDRFAKLEQNTTNLGQSVDRLQKSYDLQLERLLKITPSSLNEIIPYPEKNPSANLISTAFQQAAHVIDTAFKVELGGNTNELAPLKQRVTKLSTLYSGNGVVQKAAESLQVRLMSEYAASMRVMRRVWHFPVSTSHVS